MTLPANRIIRFPPDSEFRLRVRVRSDRIKASVRLLRQMKTDNRHKSRPQPFDLVGGTILAGWRERGGLQLPIVQDVRATGLGQTHLQDSRRVESNKLDRLSPLRMQVAALH